MSWLHKSPSDKVMMTIDKGDRSSSPVHLHVDDATPVHVHVKKPKKPLTSTMASKSDNPKSKLVQDAKMKSAASFGDSNLRRNATTATARARSKSPSRNNWVPPPGKTTKNGKLAWQGPSHRLEITNPEMETLRMTDLNTDDEDAVGNKMRNYERKIDSLMSEVGTLKNEVGLQKSLREIEEKNEVLESSRRVMEEQESELEGYRAELDATETENRILRRSMDKLCTQSDVSRSHKSSTHPDILMNKLVEVEMDSQAAAKQVAALKDVIGRLREEKRISSDDATMLTRQKDVVMQHLADFEIANRTLRTLLRDRHEQESGTVRTGEHRDLLLRKLSEMEDEVQHYRSQNYEKDRVLADYRMQIDSQKEENVAMNNFQSSLETTRGHLQKQLRQKDGDCNRMAVQIRSLESQLAQEKIDGDHLRQLLGTAKEKAERDKEALKKATRVQKNRATKSEDAVEHLNAQLMERDATIAEQGTELDGLRARCDKLLREKAQSAAESSGLKIRLSELENLLEQLEYDTKAKIEATTARLQDKTSESSQQKLENERLKTSLSLVEDKLVQAEQEMTQLRTSLRQYENLVEEYRSQMNRSRRDADESIIQLDEAKREVQRTQKDGELVLDEVKSRLQSRLQELEPIPELLKTTELRLQDANEKLLSYERRNTESTKLIAELTAKVEHQAKQSEDQRENLSISRDENRSLHSKLESFERKMQDLEAQNNDLQGSVVKREETMHHSNMRLDEKTRECTSLARQLESALAEARRQSELTREKSSSKDRTTQSRLLDLESQLSQARAEIARVKREKEEAERKFNSRLYDLKDRLEQSHSTNRSMQNYVQFLKNSYANVFGDTSVAMTSSPIRSNFH